MTPRRRHQAVDGDHNPPLQHQGTQHRPRLRTAQGETRTPSRDLQRPQHTKADGDPIHANTPPATQW